MFGVSGCGTVFKIQRSGSSWLLQPLYQFRGGGDGAVPNATAVVGPDGAVYGSTTVGGQGSCNAYGGVTGCGAVFRLTPPATFCGSVLCSWSERLLYRFTGGSDGQFPIGELTFDQSGNLYGATEGGGISCLGSAGCGVVFELTPSLGNWTESVLYSFIGGSDGAEPAAGVIFDRFGRLNGNVYTWRPW